MIFLGRTVILLSHRRLVGEPFFGRGRGKYFLTLLPSSLSNARAWRSDPSSNVGLSHMLNLLSAWVGAIVAAPFPRAWCAKMPIELCQ
jgi:hypothetical protein